MCDVCCSQNLLQKNDHQSCSLVATALTTAAIVPFSWGLGRLVLAGLDTGVALPER